MNLRKAARRAHETARAHGFWDDVNEPVENWRDEHKGQWYWFNDIWRDVVNTKLLLIVSEVSEAVEEHRASDRTRDRFGDELADIVIRTLDLAYFLGIDMEECVADKMAENEERPIKHGGKHF